MLHHYFQLKAMDTEIEIEGSGLIDNVEWKTNIADWFAEFENICSRFRETSELSILNQQPMDVVIQIHPILYEILKKAIEYAEKTEFYFNPFIGSALKAHGYNKTFAEISNRTEFTANAYEFKWNCQNPITFIPVINAIIKNVDDDIDLGGIGKGWSVDNVSAIVRNMGLNNGIVNAGGDLFVWGELERTIGIAHPEPKHSDKDIIQFAIRNGGVATSNTLYRSWNVGAERYHHILDGHRGISSQSDIVQATAFSNNTTEADVIAKILCMHSFDDAIPWLTKYFSHAGCIVIKDDGKVAVSQSVKKYITRLVM